MSTDTKVRPPGSELIPDDGVVDDLAIELMLRGDRKVRLTREERIRAAVLIIQGGGDAKQVRYRLNVSASVADSIMDAVHARLGVPMAG